MNSVKTYYVKHCMPWSMSTNADSYVFRINRLIESNGDNVCINRVKEAMNEICPLSLQQFYGIEIVSYEKDLED